MKKLLLPTFVVLGALIMTPNVHAQKWKEKLNNAVGNETNDESKGYDRERDLAKIGGPFADQGMTSDLHTKHVGKIVFAKEKIPMNGASESNFQNSFGTSDNIYGRVYMPHSVENYPTYSKQMMRSGDTTQPNHNKYGTFFYKLYVDGELSNWPIENVQLAKNNLLNTTTYQVWIHPKPEDQKVNDAWKDIVNNLSDGEHTIRVEAISGSSFGSYECPEPIAIGEFKMVKGSGDSFSADYGKTFDDVESKMSDPELEKKMLAAAQNYAKENGYKEDFRAVKIANEDWTTIYHELTGAVLRRIIDVNCYAVWPDGHCTTQKFVFGQEHIGGGKYSETVKFHGVTYGSYAENLNCK